MSDIKVGQIWKKKNEDIYYKITESDSITVNFKIGFVKDSWFIKNWTTIDFFISQAELFLDVMPEEIEKDLLFLL